MDRANCSGGALLCVARRRVRGCGWRNRRIAKDYENLAGTLAAFVTLACIQIAVRRLAR